MKLNFKLWAMTAVALFAMNSCTQEEEISNMGGEKGTPVNFVMGVNTITRTVTEDNSYATTFTDGDEVGIFAYTSEGTAVAGAQNVLYTFNGTTWESSNPISMTSDDTYTFYAYYPYNADVTSAESVNLSVSTTQNTDGYTKSDALTATSASVTGAAEGTTTTVPLTFAHAFSMVQVTLDGDQASDAATVTLYNVATSATIDLTTGTATAATETGIVSMKNCDPEPVDGKYSYRAIVPVQTIAQNTELLRTTSNGTVYSFTYTSDVPYNKGKLRQINVTLGQTANESTITISDAQDMIENWEGDTDLEPGGEGEIIDEPEIPAEPMTSLDLSQLMNSSMSFESKENWSSIKLTDATNYWYTRASTVTTVSYDETEGAISAVNAATTTRATWNNDSFGYHIGTQPVNNTYYKLTFDVKSTIVGNQVIAVGVRNATDTKSFRIANLNSGLRNQIAVNCTDANVNQYQSIEVVVDFSQASSTTNLNDNTFSASEASDLNGITIYFFNNFNQSSAVDPQSFTTYFKNIKIEEYSEYTEQ